MEVNQAGQMDIHNHVLHMPRHDFKGSCNMIFPGTEVMVKYCRVPQLFILTFLKTVQYLSFSGEWRLPPASVTSQRDFSQALSAPYMHLTSSHGLASVEIA